VATVICQLNHLLEGPHDRLHLPFLKETTKKLADHCKNGVREGGQTFLTGGGGRHEARRAVTAAMSMRFSAIQAVAGWFDLPPSQSSRKRRPL
jgi:hypothetical protein